MLTQIPSDLIGDFKDLPSIPNHWVEGLMSKHSSLLKFGLCWSSSLMDLQWNLVSLGSVVKIPDSKKKVEIWLMNCLSTKILNCFCYELVSMVSK